VAVSKRIAEYLPNKSVLLIEAGPDGRNIPQINVPGRKGTLLGSAYDWNFTTTPQSAANNRVLNQNRGRVLGGSSALNLLSWDRGAQADYNSWEELGNPGWGWNSLFPFMKKAETYQTTVNGSSGIHGTGFSGPIHYLVNRLTSAQNEAFFPAVTSLGLKQTYDFLAGQPPAYLAEATTNLHILLNTTVQREA
jgi:choline dehydrogenase-like flavoprotein